MAQRAPRRTLHVITIVPACVGSRGEAAGESWLVLYSWCRRLCPHGFRKLSANEASPGAVSAGPAQERVSLGPGISLLTSQRPAAGEGLPEQARCSQGYNFVQQPSAGWRKKRRPQRATDRHVSRYDLCGALQQAKVRVSPQLQMCRARAACPPHVHLLSQVARQP